AVGTVNAIDTTGSTLSLTFLTGFVADTTPSATARNIVVQNRVGNGDSRFIFPLATAFTYSGNDVIDARGAFSGPTDSSASIGITAYGGPGDDTIYGSQAGDQLAGGSGNDRIYGERGVDLIYGDDGFNVNVITRDLSVVTSNTSSKADADLLVAGRDLLYGDGPDAVTSGPTDGFADVIFRESRLGRPCLA